MSKRLSGLVVLACLSASAVAVELNGQLDWAGRVTLSVPIDGVVTHVNARPGATLDSGAELVRLDARVAEAHIAQARGAVRKLELLRAEAQRELERAQELYDRTVLSQHELQVAEIAAAGAEADYQAARSAQVASEVALELHTVKAPFACRVLEVHVAPGQAVLGTQRVQPLITVAARDRLRLRATLDAQQDVAVAPDSDATVDVGGQRFDARIVAVGALPADAAGGMRRVIEAEFSVPADAAVQAGQAAALVLP